MSPLLCIKSQENCSARPNKNRERDMLVIQTSYPFRIVSPLKSKTLEIPLAARHFKKENFLLEIEEV